jgi:hypothetical protein
MGLAGVVSLAENIDPLNDNSQYAYAENVGWLNAEPSGNGGPGLQVTDFELTGWMWGENVGWVSLSCMNTATCSTFDYRVRNDGNGILSGYAWGENIGWINFSPATAGVRIDTSTGDFNGRAWGENVGWVTFASTGPSPYKVTTAWNCDPPPAPPSGVPVLSLEETGTTLSLSWTATMGATGADVVRGSLSTLRSTLGDYSAATTQCTSNNNTSASLTLSDTPPPGEGFWFLVRGANCGGNGSYDSGGAGQVGSRDAEIAASGHDCQ